MYMYMYMVTCTFRIFFLPKLPIIRPHRQKSTLMYMYMYMVTCTFRIFFLPKLPIIRPHRQKSTLMYMYMYMVTCTFRTFFFPSSRSLGRIAKRAPHISPHNVCCQSAAAPRPGSHVAKLNGRQDSSQRKHFRHRACSGRKRMTE